MHVTNEFHTEGYDAVVVGAGHAGCEAALALARTGIPTLLLSLNLDSIAFMACNPSVGGTAKGQLVREIDALGGEMGLNADATALQMRMLNVGKGAAVQSLRAQADKHAYHARMKKVLESTENLTLAQGEAAELLVKDGAVCGVKTTFGEVIAAKAVVLATGVYLNGSVVAGEFRQSSGPNGFAPANELTANLISLGFAVRRFKTGTPARVDGRTIDFSKCERQDGDTKIYPFPYLTDSVPQEQLPCYLTYTNERTHAIIRANLHRSPLYSGQINGTSGYEEAAAQGLMAGLNASLALRGKPPLILRRDQAYIGVLIDDLVTKGTNEPYRMMTSRAEHRIHLRQDNADLRLTELGYAAGLVTAERYERFLARKAAIERIANTLNERVSPKRCTDFVTAHGGPAPAGGMSYADMLRRGIGIDDVIREFGILSGERADDIETAAIDIRYEGYLKRGLEQIEKAKKLEDKKLPPDLDYESIDGLRIEARQKLNKIRPENLGQAGRISGVNPADIAVLMVYLSAGKRK